MSQTFKTPKKIIITYDGSKESMFALKQFCYLLPQYLDLPAEIVYLNSDDLSKLLQAKLLKEYVIQNLSSVSFHKLEMEPEINFARWVLSREDALVIAGSYSRREFLNSLPVSFVDSILKMQISPGFIAHR